MKITLVSLVTAALCWSTASAGLNAREQASRECTVTKTRKTIVWDFYLSGGREADPAVTEYDLVSPGRGLGWREAYGPSDTADHVSKPILFENDQGWKVINCTWKYPAGHPARGACTSPDFALLNTPGGAIGNGPLDKGRIGTLNKLAHPKQSVWAVYDLIEFRLTPVVSEIYYNRMLTVEVFGWREDGSKTNTMRIKVKGSEVGYRVVTPEGTWDRIIQWQVRVWWSDGSRPTREDFPFIIDDMVIDEYAWDPKEGGAPWSCAAPTQVAGPEPPARTLKFDDVQANPTAPLPTPYKSYNFNSAWSVTNGRLYPYSHPGQSSFTSPPNALYGVAPNSTSYNPDLMSPDFLFDADSFHITIDTTAVVSPNPSDLEIIIQGYGPCFDIENYSGSVAGTFKYIRPDSYSFDVNLRELGYRKQRAMSLYLWDQQKGARIPFWVDDLVVRSWKEELGGLPGCERCGKFYSWFCEYPGQERVPE